MKRDACSGFDTIGRSGALRFDFAQVVPRLRSCEPRRPPVNIGNVACRATLHDSLSGPPATDAEPAPLFWSHLEALETTARSGRKNERFAEVSARCRAATKRSGLCNFGGVLERSVDRVVHEHRPLRG